MPSAKNEFRLPKQYYAAIAPLSVPMAEYLLNRLIRSRKLDLPSALSLLIKDIEEKSRIAFFAMDVYVRNQQKESNYKLTSAWVRETIGIYRPVPAATFTRWIDKGIIRTEGKGRPTASSTAAVYTALMILPGEKDIFPESIELDEPEWYCYVQGAPGKPIEVFPKNQLQQFIKTGQASSLCWTRWIGANWEGWYLVGEGEAELGAITFAGIGEYRDHLIWQVTLDDLLHWLPEAAPLAKPFPGNSLGQVQSLAKTVLSELARSRLGIYSWEGDISHAE